MATKIMTDREFTIDGQHAYVVGDTGQRGGTWTFHLQSSSFNGTVTVKGKGKRSSLTPVAILYSPHFINGSVAAAADPVSTGITGTSLIQVVVADGMDVVLDCGTYNSGSLSVCAQPSS